MKPLIVVFLKWPEPGRVKTRLATHLGSEKAMVIYRALVREVGAALASCVEEDVAVCFSPADRVDDIEQWLTHEVFTERPVHHWWPQPETDLGGRQAWAIERAWESGYDCVALIGTDCIDIDRALFQRTWAGLEKADWVFGPAKDGGYYLGATKKAAAVDSRVVFEGVRWSSAHTLEDCLDRIERQAGSAVLLDPLTDVDDVNDWNSVAERVRL